MSTEALPLTQLTPMARVSIAMGVLGWLLGLNGRRLMNAKQLARTRVYLIDPNNAARFVPMAPRKLRRKRQGRDFKPVYGFIGNAIALNAEVKALQDKLDAAGVDTGDA